MAKPKKKKPKGKQAQNYRHPESESLMRPDVGTLAQFKKKLPPKKYRYDDSLSPSLEWDGQNAVRELGEALIKEILDASSIELKRSTIGVRSCNNTFRRINYGTSWRGLFNCSSPVRFII